MSLDFQRTLVIIPTYNERDNVVDIVSKVFELYPGISLLIVDDNSPDGTSILVKNLRDKFQQLTLIERPKKMGLGSAYVVGFKWALERDFDYIIQMDCDFSHDPRDIQNIQQKIITDSADLVIGSRYIDGVRVINWPLRRLILSYMGTLYARVITGVKIHDITSGFKCFNKETLETLELDSIISSGYSFQLEVNYLVWKEKLKVVELPIIFTERILGKSKMSTKIIVEAILTVLKLKFKSSS